MDDILFFWKKNVCYISTVIITPLKMSRKKCLNYFKEVKYDRDDEFVQITSNYPQVISFIFFLDTISFIKNKYNMGDKWLPQNVLNIICIFSEIEFSYLTF